MRRFVALAVALAVTLSCNALTLAQTASEKAGNSTPASLEEAKQKRQEIEATRQREAARFDTADAECQKRFAVNDCLRSSQTSRRAVMADLRRQEATLNELERAQRGADQIEASRKKALERAQQDKDMAAAQAANREAQAQKQSEQAKKQEANRNVPLNHSGSSSQVPKAPSGPAPIEQATNRADYQRRQAEAQQHRIDLQKRQAEKAGKPPSGLPVPP